MPTLRERRTVKHPKRFDVGLDHANKRFNLDEKKKILVALKKYRDEDVVKIQAEFLPHRTCQEISHYLQKMRYKAQSRPQMLKDKVPIELWTETAQDLVGDSNDLSYLLAEVFGKIEKNELHDSKMAPEAPDWARIYKYMVQLLHGQLLPDLGQIEAGVLLDLLESLAQHLKQLDITDQRQLMEAKYTLLASQPNPDNVDEIYVLAKSALEVDLLQTSTSGYVSTTASSSSIAPGASSSSTSTFSSVSADPHPSLSTVTSETDLHGQGQDSAGPSSEDKGQTLANQGQSVAGKSSPDQPAMVIKAMELPLFTINPFNIPVKYLNPKPLTTNSNNP